MADHKIDGNDGAGNAGIDGLRLVKFENGQFDLMGGPVQYIAEYFAQMMEAGEGKYFNNMEIAFSHHDAGEMVLSVQRKSGKTPIQQRKEAEDERDAANARADRARDAALEDVAVMAHAFAAENQWHPSSVTKLVTRILALRDKPAPGATEEAEGLTGPIEVGDEFIWMPNDCSARDSITVTRVVKQKGRHEAIIWTRCPDGSENWNEESRFREACVRAYSTSDKTP